MIAVRRRRRTPPRTSALRRLALVLAPLAVTLVGCDHADRAARDACIAVLPALEEGRGAILVRSATPVAVGHGDTAVRLRWRSGAGRDAHDHETTCVFADDPTAPGGGGLVGVRTEQGVLPVARLFVLRRFWLADPALAAEGLARVSLAPDLR